MSESVILRLGAVNTDTPYSRLISHHAATEYEQCVDMSPVCDEPYMPTPQTYTPTSQTYTGYFGLPYQDHNYGAQRPATPPPPQTVAPAIVAPVTQAVRDKEIEEDVKDEIVVTGDVPMSPLMSPAPPTPGPTSPPVDSDTPIDDPTRCICDFVHDDGYMIQCDQCSVWQHIVCMGLDRDSIPDTYFCEECRPRSVDRARAREFQIRKREFLKSLIVKTHDSSTDTDPEEVSNRLKAYGLDPSAAAEKHRQKIKVKKRKERLNSKIIKKLKIHEIKTEKENTNKEANLKNKLFVKDFSSKTALVKKEKLSKKIEKMRAARISKESREDKLSSDDLRDDEKMIINTTPPQIQDENTQNPWHINAFNEWEQSYETARYNQYTTYVQEYLNSTYINGHHNDIADLVTDGLRVQRCRIIELKNKKKGLQSSCNIPDGQPVIEVIGKVMTRQQYDKDNFGQRQLSPFVFFYGKVFDLDLVIDASDYGNDARFIRRSCQPNADVRHVVAGGQAHFIAVASKEIPENTEITIPFDYDYKKWNFCVECACLRNNCPVSRYQKRRMRFQKLQIGETPNRKYHKHDKVPKSVDKSPTKSPIKSPVKSPIKTPEKPLSKYIVDQSPTSDSGVVTDKPELIYTSPLPAVTVHSSPVKMVRRSQVMRQTSNNASTQVSAGRLRSLRVPSQVSDSEVICDSVTAPEASSLRSSEVTSPMTSPEMKDTSHSHTPKVTHTHEDDAQEEPKTETRKLTREERKMEAIMKAFEKMEKRNARKASVDQHPKSKEESEQKVEIKKEKVNEVETPAAIKEEPVDSSNVDTASPVKVERTVKVEKDTVEKREEVVEENVVNIEQTSEVKEEMPSKPVLRERPPTKGKKTKKAGGRRRTRNASGGQSLEILPTVPVQEDTSCHGNVSSISCPSTPAPSVDEPSMAEVTQPSFKFLNKKRHLMNEWYSKNDDLKVASSKTDTRTDMKPDIPLEVTVEDSMFVTCLPSPRNSMDRLRRNSQSSRDRHPSVTDTGVGSAKKRWLRQAMGEGSSESGLSSPLPMAGSLSPNPQWTMPSPGGSPPVDFVTPLKKRRLARESLSRESFNSESPITTPSQTPTPVSTPSANGYFATLSETFEATMEGFRRNNGFNSFFSPLKPSDVVTEAEASKTSSRTVSSDSKSDSVSVRDSIDSMESEANPQLVSSDRISESKQTLASSAEVDSVSSCAEMDCSVSCNTGIAPSTSTDSETQISTIEAKTSSQSVDSDVLQCNSSSTSVSVVADSEQMLDCDHDMSASDIGVSEADSSDSVQCMAVTMATTAVCDTGSTLDTSPTLSSTVAEVDSTDTNVVTNHPSIEDVVVAMTHNNNAIGTTHNNVAIATTHNNVAIGTTHNNVAIATTHNNVAIGTTHNNVAIATTHNNTTSPSSNSIINSQNDQCDSCTSERSAEAPGVGLGGEGNGEAWSGTTVKMCTSSSSPSTNLTSDDETSQAQSSSISSVTIDRTSQSVVSSTDQPIEAVIDSFNVVSTSVTESENVNINSVAVSLEPIASFGFEVGSEVINSTDEPVCQENEYSVVCNARESELAPSVASTTSSVLEMVNVPNPHLRFLSDNYSCSTDMTVDSTTHALPHVTTLNGYITASSSSNIGYDSDSMDVTSASDAGMNGHHDDRSRSDDSMSGYPETSSTSDQSIPAKEKKKVSLQEYLKRKKDHVPYPAANKSTGSVSGGVSSTVVNSPLKFTTHIPLEKLPPLPSLPSLPMFEKTERKEFKSSSDLLSPIFNRKDKQIEVRKPMSLSERLRSEFGLDDSTDTDTDTENKHEGRVLDLGVETSDDPPPPPPPPPQCITSRVTQLKMAQQAAAAAAQGSSTTGPAPIPSLMSIKPYTSTMMKLGDPGGPSIPKMVQPSAACGKPIPAMVAAASVTPVNGSTGITNTASGGGKLTSPLSASLTSFLAGVKTPAQLQTDLTASLAALKAQINKVQHSLPNSSSSTTSTIATAVASTPLPVSVNGNDTSNIQPQVFDYGHQSSGVYMRQNSYPSTSSKLYPPGYSRTSPSVSKTSPGYSKFSPRYNKVSPTSGTTQCFNHSNTNNHTNNHQQNNNSAGSHHQQNNNSAGSQAYNGSNSSNTHNVSPSWNQSNHNSHKQISSSSASTNRKRYQKQTSNKY